MTPRLREVVTELFEEFDLAGEVVAGIDPDADLMLAHVQDERDRQDVDGRREGWSRLITLADGYRGSSDGSRVYDALSDMVEDAYEYDIFEVQFSALLALELIAWTRASYLAKTTNPTISTNP